MLCFQGTKGFSVLRLLAISVIFAHLCVPASAQGGSITVEKQEGGQNKVTITYSASDAKTVHLSGTFNGWSTDKDPMTRVGDTFTVTLPLPNGTYEYKFHVNGTEWRYDPRNPNTVQDPYGGQNSLLQVGASTGDPANAASRVEIRWRTSLREAMQEAARDNKRIIIFFANRQSQAAINVEDFVLSVAPVAPYINNTLVPFRLDLNIPADRELAKKLSVFRAGTITVYSSAGQPIKLITSVFQPSQLMTELRSASQPQATPKPATAQ